MASLKRIGLWDLKEGMIVVRCDRSGVPFNEYGRPLINLDAVHRLSDYGVENVYIWSDDKKETSNKDGEKGNVEYIIHKEDDIHSINLAAASELVGRSHKTLIKSITNLKKGSVIEIQAISSVVSDLIFMSAEIPGIFTSIASAEGMGEEEYFHGLNVCLNAISIGQMLNVRGEELTDLGIAGLLHDIGKSRLPQKLIDKKDKLTEYDISVLKRHPEYGQQILARYNQISDDVITSVLQHHELCDGTGYPSGLTGKYLSKSSKILAVSEAYHTMLTDNVEYRKVSNNTDAIKRIYAGIGKQYSADVVKAFVTIMGVYPVGTAVRLNNSHIAIVCEQNKADQSKPKVLSLGSDGHSKVVELVNLKKHENLKIVSSVNHDDFHIDPGAVFNKFLQSRIKSQLSLA